MRAVCPLLKTVLSCFLNWTLWLMLTNLVYTGTKREVLSQLCCHMTWILKQFIWDKVLGRLAIHHNKISDTPGSIFPLSQKHMYTVVHIYTSFHLSAHWIKDAGWTSRGMIPRAFETLSANQTGRIGYTVINVSAPVPQGYRSRGLFDRRLLRKARMTGVRSTG